MLSSLEYHFTSYSRAINQVHPPYHVHSFGGRRSGSEKVGSFGREYHLSQLWNIQKIRLWHRLCQVPHVRKSMAQNGLKEEPTQQQIFRLLMIVCFVVILFSFAWKMPGLQQLQIQSSSNQSSLQEFDHELLDGWRSLATQKSGKRCMSPNMAGQGASHWYQWTTQRRG